MTLGGMALAVGILVDDATVEIENIHRNLHHAQAAGAGDPRRCFRKLPSRRSSATLCICIVFVPVVFITGAAKYLFTPLAMAVVFAMMTSYLLSRTLVPTMVHYLLAAEVEMYGGVLDEDDPHAVHARHAQEAREHGEPVPVEDESLDRPLAAQPFDRALIPHRWCCLAVMADLAFSCSATRRSGLRSRRYRAGLMASRVGFKAIRGPTRIEIGLALAIAFVVFFWLMTLVTKPIHDRIQ